MQAGELTAKAWYLSGIVARDLDEVSGSQGPDGMFWLNQILAEQRITGRLLPYYTTVSVNMVVGQEKYFFERLVNVACATFNIQSVRYSMTRVSRDQFFGTPRVDNINSLPFSYYTQRVNGGTDIYVYWKPQSASYILNVTGQFGFEEVVENTDMDDVYDDFYQLYLMYELAAYLCDWYKVTLPPMTQMKLQELTNNLADLNPIDLTTFKQAGLGGNGPNSIYAQANFGKGWTPFGRWG